jgi:hypothetical protein
MCGRCNEEAEELPFRCSFCAKHVSSDCADIDGTGRAHPGVAQLSEQKVAERVQEMRRRGNRALHIPSMPTCRSRWQP